MVDEETHREQEQDEDVPLPALDPEGTDVSGTVAPDLPAPASEPAERPPKGLGLGRLDVVLLVAITLLTGVLHMSRLANPDAEIPRPPEAQGRFTFFGFERAERRCASDPKAAGCEAVRTYREQCRDFPRRGPRCHSQIPLDEHHYLPDARDVLLYGTESDTRVPDTDGAFVVHPPVGKWFIAAGILIFGDSGFGWRFPGALLGTLAVVILYLLARRFWPSPWLAAMAALLLGVEGLWFVMSRIAMLDITMAVFVLLAIWLLVEDHERTYPDHRGIRWWRLGAGAAFGIALATKWGAIPFWLVALALALTWEMHRGFRVRFEDRRMRARMWTTVGSLFVLPLVLYTLTYMPWFTDAHRYEPPRCERMESTWYADRGVTRVLTGWVADIGRFGQWICYQREMYDFHKNLEKYETVGSESDSPGPEPVDPRTTAKQTTDAERVKKKPAHPYFGNAWTWPWIGRPVVHYFETYGEGDDERVKHVLGLPNPAIWWPAFALGIPALLWSAIRRRDRAASLILAFIGAGWVPYLYADTIDRSVFLFYALPMVPFLVLAVVHLIASAMRRFVWASAVTIAYVVIVLLAFAYFYPVLAAFPIGRDGWLGWGDKMWFNVPHTRVFGRHLIPGDCSAVDVIKNFCWI